MRYLKDTRITYYRHGEDWQDSEGGWHEGDLAELAKPWAHIAGRDHAAEHAEHNTWDAQTFKATFTRYRGWCPRVGDVVEHDGDLYQVVAVDLLSGKPGADVKVTCEIPAHGITLG